jgi:hypothetical protein
MIGHLSVYHPISPVLFHHLPILFWRQPGQFLEQAKEILRVIEPERLRHLVYFFIGGSKQILGFIDSRIVDIIDKIHTGLLFEEMAAIAWVKEEDGGYLFE